MHIGTFTPESTWAAAMAQLPHLAALGVTLLEIMSVADFPGRYGWGNEGVNPARMCISLPRPSRCSLRHSAACGKRRGPAKTRATAAPALRENVFHDFSMDIREAEVAALETIGQLLVIEAEQVHDRRLQVVDVDFVFDD